MDEVEIRELLIDHVGHHCCWGSRPARTWKIEMLEDCNVYVGTLDTFTEEREVIKEHIPYHGGNVDRKGSVPELGVWELDLRSQFPVLFTPEKETRIKVPHSEAIEKCPGIYMHYFRDLDWNTNDTALILLQVVMVEGILHVRHAMQIKNLVITKKIR